MFKCLRLFLGSPSALASAPKVEPGGSCLCGCSKVERPHWQLAAGRGARGGTLERLSCWRAHTAGHQGRRESGQQLKLLFDFCFLSFPQVVGATMSLCVPPSPISILVPSRGHYSRGRRRSHRGPGQGGMSSFTVTELSVASHGGVFVSGTLFLGQALSSHFIINPSNSVRLVLLLAPFLQGV